MRELEAAQILRTELLARFPDRALEPGTPDAWYADLGDLDADEVRTAIRTAARTRSEWPTPAVLRRIVADTAGLVPPATSGVAWTLVQAGDWEFGRWPELDELIRRVGDQYRLRGEPELADAFVEAYEPVAERVTEGILAADRLGRPKPQKGQTVDDVPLVSGIAPDGDPWVAAQKWIDTARERGILTGGVYDQFDFANAFAYNSDSAPFHLGQVIDVEVVQRGENDERVWIWMLSTGWDRLWSAVGGCDLTGWDCQSWLVVWPAGDPVPAALKTIEESW
jgi:hypothetical protein